VRDNRFEQNHKCAPWVVYNKKKTELTAMLVSSTNTTHKDDTVKENLESSTVQRTQV
jgi:hypothetical protein